MKTNSKIMGIIAGEMAITDSESVYADNAINLYKKMDRKEQKAIKNFIEEYAGINIESYIDIKKTNIKNIGHGWLVNVFDDNDGIKTIEYNTKEYMMAHLANDINNSSTPETAFIIPPGEGIKAINFLKAERKKENYFKDRYQNILGNYVIGLEKFPNKFSIGDLHQSDYAVTGDFADYQGILELKNGDYIEVWAALEHKEHESGARGAFLNSIIFEDSQQNVFYENENLMSAFMLQKLGFFVKDVVDVVFDEDKLLNENEEKIFYSFGFCPRLK